MASLPHPRSTLFNHLDDRHLTFAPQHSLQSNDSFLEQLQFRQV